MEKLRENIFKFTKTAFAKYVFIMNWSKQWHICHYIVWCTLILAIILLSFSIQYHVDILTHPDVDVENEIAIITPSGEFYTNSDVYYSVQYILFLYYLAFQAFGVIFIFPITLLIYFVCYLCKKDFKIKNKFLHYNPIYTIIYNTIYNIIMLYFLFIAPCYFIFLRKLL